MSRDIPTEYDRTANAFFRHAEAIPPTAGQLEVHLGDRLPRYAPRQGQLSTVQRGNVKKMEN